MGLDEYRRGEGRVVVRDLGLRGPDEPEIAQFDGEVGDVQGVTGGLVFVALDSGATGLFRVAELEPYVEPETKKPAGK